MSLSATNQALALTGEAPRRTISASRGWLTSGFTAVRVSVLPFSEADPFSPQKLAGLPSRSQRASGAENSARTAIPPWCAAYISKTLKFGVEIGRAHV